ncbi:MAG TPA: DUF3500 domain-containing protein [Blastocatellia bacterium]|nr:DUF3500 domain-containing protein [Blastocatellia bacterium]
MCNLKPPHNHIEEEHHEEHPQAGRRQFLSAALIGAPLLLPVSNSHMKGQKVARANMPVSTMPSAGSMKTAAEAFLSILTEDQRAKATYKLDDEERKNWFYTPVARKGLTIKDLDPAQRQLANVLLGSGLAQHGLLKVATIMSIEPVLREIEQARGPVRDPELYYFTLFGKPGSAVPWAWRFEGHHISLHYTVAGDKLVASTPSFLGSNPSEIQHGPRKGLRPLAAEEDMGRALVKSLDDKQRAVAVVSQEAPRDILTTNGRKADPIKPAGLPASRLGQKQQEMLMNLVKEYAANMPTDVAAARMDRVRAGGFGNIFFAWAGQFEHLRPHYYRIQGPNFLIEYDCTQNNANHIHSVWRDFNGDFGNDLLARHYEQGHR